MNRNNEVETNLYFKYTNKIIYSTAGNSQLRKRKLSLRQIENLLPLTLCPYFCILSIVKIGGNHEDAMLLRGSKKM